MAFELMKFNEDLLQSYALTDILGCNEWSAPYGLVLTQPQALELVETRQGALKNNGRVEFGGGIIEKIIKAFCASPYLTTENYGQMLHELVDTFYAYKNETLDMISDDDLIALMSKLFDGICQGSLEQLSQGELEKIGRQVRRGQDYRHFPEDELEEEDDNEWS